MYINNRLVILKVIEYVLCMLRDRYIFDHSHLFSQLRLMNARKLNRATLPSLRKLTKKQVREAFGEDLIFTQAEEEEMERRIQLERSMPMQQEEEQSLGTMSEEDLVKAIMQDLDIPQE